MNELVAWLDHHQGGAAWVQSLGALLALFVAILLNRADARERGKERLDRARSAAVALSPFVARIADGLAWALQQRDKGERPDNIGTSEDQQTISVGDEARISIEFKAAFSLTSQLASAAKPTQQLYYELERFRGYLNSVTDDSGDPDEQGYHQQFHEDIWRRVAMLQTSALAAHQALLDLIDVGRIVR